MSTGMIALVSIVCLIAIANGALLYRAIRFARYPKTWEHIGAKPPGADTAVSIIMSKLPWLRNGGTIEWTSEPFEFRGILVAGCVISFDAQHVKILARGFVERTALARELGFIGWRLRTGHVEEDTVTFELDPDFAEWLTETNRQIAAALGR